MRKCWGLVVGVTFSAGNFSLVPGQFILSTVDPAIAEVFLSDPLTLVTGSVLRQVGTLSSLELSDYQAQVNSIQSLFDPFSQPQPDKKLSIAVTVVERGKVAAELGCFVPGKEGHVVIPSELNVVDALLQFTLPQLSSLHPHHQAMFVAGLDLQVAPLEWQDPTGGFQVEDCRGGFTQHQGFRFFRG